MVRSRIDVPESDVAAFCRRHHIRRLALFGSVLREDFGPDSDVDVLVEFEDAYIPGFLRLHDLAEELGRLFGGRRVDLVTRKALNRRIRDQVLADAQTLHGEP